ncbi:MAG: M23 family metallopeptidase [Caulobacteraceae bacterium]
MSFRRVTRLARSLADLFPERHLYLRSGGEMRGYVLTTPLQLKFAAAVAVLALWMGISTAGLLVALANHSKNETAIAQVQAKYERWIADRQARLVSAVTQLNGSSHSLDALADTMERRHAALAMLLVGASQASGGDAGPLQALRPAAIDPSAPPAARIEAVRLDQERMMEAAETFAKSRADRLRLAFRLAGLDPAVYAGRSDALGGPLIEAKDPRALAAILDVNEDVAKRIDLAASDLAATRNLSEAAQDLPLAKPTANTQETSGFGVRVDPFTGEPAFHSGQDFAGPFMTPIHATAPGVVSFTGVRSGYGNTIEIDHGHGFKTRYGHLAAISVKVGQRVALGQRIGGMGSTGRSTGDHLHYEVWVNGRPQNPSRFLKAGDYVQQTE